MKGVHLGGKKPSTHANPRANTLDGNVGYMIWDGSRASERKPGERTDTCLGDVFLLLLSLLLYSAICLTTFERT